MDINKWKWSREYHTLLIGETLDMKNSTLFIILRNKCLIFLIRTMVSCIFESLFDVYHICDHLNKIIWCFVKVP